jgi:hypothetical protein
MLQFGNGNASHALRLLAPPSQATPAEPNLA